MKLAALVARPTTAPPASRPVATPQPAPPPSGSPLYLQALPVPSAPARVPTSPAPPLAAPPIRDAEADRCEPDGADASYPESIPEPTLVSEGPPTTDGPTFVIDDIELADDVAFCRWQLDQLADRDLDAPTRFVENFRVTLEQERERQVARARVGDVQPAEESIDRGLRELVWPSLDEAHQAQRRDNRLLLYDFDDLSVKTTVEILRSSRRQVEGERAHYGVTAHRVEQAYIEDVGDHGWRKKTRTVSVYGMSDGTAARELAVAAGMLLDKRREIAALERARDASVVWKTDHGRDQIAAPSLSAPAFDARTAELQRARADYARLVGYLEGEFPLLASFPMRTSSEYLLPAFRGSEEAEGTVQLDQIANATRPRAAQAIGARIDEVVANIDRSLEALADGDLKPWQLARIVAATKLRLGVVEGSPQDRLIDRAIQERVEDEALRAGLFAAFTIALGLIAAIPSGGLSLGASIVVTGAALGTAALSAYGLYQGLKEYEVQAAARDSAFNRALAISQAEPSLSGSAWPSSASAWISARPPVRSARSRRPRAGCERPPPSRTPWSSSTRSGGWATPPGPASATTSPRACSAIPRPPRR